MSTSTVTSKGQITIPIEVRRKLHLEAGSRVEFVELPGGSYELIPATRSVKELRGIVKYSGSARTFEEMDEGIADATNQRVRQ